LNERILYGMSRNAPPTALFCTNRLARKRASPFTPKERSISCSSSKRAFCESVSTE
jgi:hypothetical protein